MVKIITTCNLEKNKNNLVQSDSDQLDRVCSGLRLNISQHCSRLSNACDLWCATYSTHLTKWAGLNEADSRTRYPYSHNSNCLQRNISPNVQQHLIICSLKYSTKQTKHSYIGKLAHLLFETNDYITTYGYGTKVVEIKDCKELNLQLFICIYIIYVCIAYQYSSEIVW